MISKYRKIILLIIILLGFSLRYYAASSIHITWDEECDLRLAQTISFDRNNLNLPLVDKVNPVEQASVMIDVYLLRLIYDIFGHSLLALRLSVVTFDLFTILIVYLLTRQTLGVKVALLSSLLLSISQFEVAMDRTANDAPLYILFFLLSLFLFYRAIQTSNKKLMLLNGLVIGVGFWMKENMLFLVPIYFIFLLVSPEYRNWLKNRYFWISFGLAFLIALPLVIMSYNTPRYQYLTSIASIGPSLNGVGLYLGELILVVIKWFASTKFFYSVCDTLTRETPPVNFMLGIVILVAVIKSMHKRSSLVRLLLICFLFNFLLFCFVRKCDVIDGIWSLGSLEWGAMGFIPGVILASNMLVGYVKKSRIKGSIFLWLLVSFIFIRTWDMASFPLCCYFPEREWCIKDELYNKAERFLRTGKVDLAKETLRKVYRVTHNKSYKTHAALRLARILIKEEKIQEAKKYLYAVLSDNPQNSDALELLESSR